MPFNFLEFLHSSSGSRYLIRFYPLCVPRFNCDNQQQAALIYPHKCQTVINLYSLSCFAVYSVQILHVGKDDIPGMFQMQLYEKSISTRVVCSLCISTQTHLFPLMLFLHSNQNIELWLRSSIRCDETVRGKIDSCEHINFSLPVLLIILLLYYTTITLDEK